MEVPARCKLLRTLRLLRPMAGLRNVGDYVRHCGYYYRLAKVDGGAYLVEQYKQGR